MDLSTHLHRKLQTWHRTSRGPSRASGPSQAPVFPFGRPIPSQRQDLTRPPPSRGFLERFRVGRAGGIILQDQAGPGHLGRFLGCSRTLRSGCYRTLRLAPWPPPIAALHPGVEDGAGLAFSAVHTRPRSGLIGDGGRGTRYSVRVPGTHPHRECDSRACRHQRLENPPR